MFQYFYHQRLRKSVAVFGALFNNIYVLRKDSNGKVISQIKVPLAYAPRSKYLERIRANPDLINDTKVAIKLPRMSFEITGLFYDPTRKLPKLNNYNTPATNESRNKFFTPVPYLISFQLNIFAKNQDDALQIVEQILPYFNPQYSLTIKPFPDDPTIREDVPVLLQGVSFMDDFEGPLEERRTIIYTLDFTMNANFYGPIGDQAIIRQAITTVHDAVTFDDEIDPKIERVTVTPNPADASPDSDYGFTTLVEEDFLDE